MLRARRGGKVQTAIEAVIERGAVAFADAWSYIPTKGNEAFWGELREELGAAEVEVQGLKTENQGLKAAIAENADLKSEVDRLKQAVECDVQKIHLELDDTRGRYAKILAEKERENKCLEAAYADLSKRLEVARRENDDLARDIQSLLAEKDRLAQNHGYMQDAHSELASFVDQLKGEKEALQKDNERLTANYKHVYALNAELQQRNQVQEGKITLLEKERNYYINAHANALEMVSSMNLENAGLRKHNTALEEKIEQLPSYAASSRAQAKAMKEVESKLSAQEKLSEHLRASLVQLEASYKSLDGMYKDVCRRLAGVAGPAYRYSNPSSPKGTDTYVKLGDTTLPWHTKYSEPVQDAILQKQKKAHKRIVAEADLEADKLAARQQAERVQQVQAEGEEGLKFVLKKVYLGEPLSSVQQLALWNHYRLNALESGNTKQEWSFADCTAECCQPKKNAVDSKQ